MNIQGYAAAWRPTNTSYAAKQTDTVSNDNTFSNILHSKTEEKTQYTNKLNVFYKGVPLEEWAKIDPKYTDPETGISWYIRDGIHPYMLDEDAEKLNQLCEKTGEFPLKKFGEIVGNIQQLDENTVAYVGTNGTVIKDKEGNELFIDTSHLTYDMIMDLFDNLPETDNYFEQSFWAEQMDRVSQKQNENTYTPIDLYNVFHDEVQSNQYRKKSLYEMVKDSCIEGTNAKFRFVGEDKIYDFYEYIDKIQGSRFSNSFETQYNK